MAKLFAMEELDVPSDEIELSVTPEEGEVANVQAEVQEEVADIDDSAEAIEDGMGAADQLEEVETVVADAVQQGDGLDPVAAEAIRLAIEAISARVGANPKAVYSLYATENFQSASSRKANTKFALEGIGEFLKDMWKKIKAALSRLWEKVKAFWDKHVSSLGQIKKALESMKKKVAASSGKFEGKAYVEEAPGALSTAFGFAGEITANSISGVIKTHASASSKSADIGDKIAKLNDVAGGKNPTYKDLINAVTTGDVLESFGPMVGGVTVKTETEVDEEQGTVSVNFTEETTEVGEKVGLALGDKNAVKGVLDSVLSVINEDIKVRDKVKKAEESFKKAANAVEKSINESITDKASADKAKELRKQMKIVYAFNSKLPLFQTKVGNFNIRLAKAVLGYAGLCVKNYK